MRGLPVQGGSAEMICVTIGRGRHSSLAEEWKQAAEAGVDLVELRIDCLRREPDLKRILKDRPTPLVFTIRRGVDGGLWRGNEDKRQQLLREAVALGVDYVDLEMDIATKIRRFGKTKRIVSYHNMKTTPVDLEDIADKCAEFDPDVVKIATVGDDAGRGLAGLAPGDQGQGADDSDRHGRDRRLHPDPGPQVRCPVHLRRVQSRAGLRRGDAAVRRAARTTLPTTQINANTEIYGVIGDPIEQSLSPVVHNAAFRELGLNKVMVPFLVPNGELPAFFKELLWLDMKGCSVTIPHKEAIVPLLQQKEGAVERTGSCNTVVFKEDGQRVGYNTDYRAAMDSLEAAMGGPRQRGRSPSPLFDKQVLILGAGGVARAIAFGLTRRGAHVTITNRHDDRADPAGRGSRLPHRHLVDAGQHRRRRDHQRDSGRNAPQRRRHAASRRRRSAGREWSSSTRSIIPRTR